MTAHPGPSTPVANFCLAATLPPARDATSASAVPHFRRRVGYWAGRVVAPCCEEIPSEPSRAGVAPGGCAASLLVALPHRPSLLPLRPVGRQPALKPSVLHPHGAVAVGPGLLRGSCHRRDNNNNRPGGKGIAAAVSCFFSARPQTPGATLCQTPLAQRFSLP